MLRNGSPTSRYLYIDLWYCSIGDALKCSARESSVKNIKDLVIQDYSMHNVCLSKCLGLREC